MVGFGLWNSIPGTILVEGSLFAAGLWLYTPRPPSTALVEPEDGEVALNQRQRVPRVAFRVNPPGPMREDDDRRSLDTFQQVEGVVEPDAAILEVPVLGHRGERRER